MSHARVRRVVRAVQVEGLRYFIPGAVSLARLDANRVFYCTPTHDKNKHNNNNNNMLRLSYWIFPIIAGLVWLGTLLGLLLHCEFVLVFS